ncbi:prepilin-type N-terminal cleavage/methylation domain-containing protein [Syntrophomonas palmitatica]|uniref:prepilin-type N-terminal cleavage/methylation domain-containing protein n=1 Tax=Syntrophomonas palmitatica TaxID=402877 RepID=UPI0006D1FB92|nr:prepilin-type N-terminal cleavage/methylation domain-containing protein [Syntrophomonas palmitatica]
MRICCSTREIIKESAGFSLMETMAALAIVCLIACLVLSISVAAADWTQQAGRGFKVGHYAFSILEAIRAEADVLDFDKPILLSQLMLANPEGIPAVIEVKKEEALSSVYYIRVQAGDGDNWPLLKLQTLVRKND